MLDAKTYSMALEEASDLSEIFEIAKSLAKDFLGRERSGLMLGIAELGGKPGAFVGAFYPIGSNLIVLNKTPLRIIEHTRLEYYKYYVFHLLLHEYLHTVGILDENLNRKAVIMISEKAFGKNHPVSIIAKDMTQLFPEVIYASLGWKPNDNPRIELVENFENDYLRYIG